MDRTIPPGSNLEALRVQFGTIEPQEGDLVIAQRQRHDLIEMTCKRLARDGDGWELRCESTKPEFAEMVIKVGAPDASQVNDDETIIVGIVVNAYQSHFRRRF